VDKVNSIEIINAIEKRLDQIEESQGDPDADWGRLERQKKLLTQTLKQLLELQ